MGESAESALIRELQEEMHLQVKIVSRLEPVPWQGKGPEIILHPFICTPDQDSAPVPLDHSEIRWIRPEEAPQLDWAPADQPLVVNLKRLL